MAVVTGATRGIGRAIAIAFGRAGATVVVSSEDAAACRETESEFRAAGFDAHGIACDVAEPDQLVALVEQVTSALGPLGVLVCNAGIEGPVGPIHPADPVAYQRVMDINLHSAVRLTSLVVPAMAESGGGSVILMASIAGLRGNKSLGVYALAKAAVAQLARNLAVEWGPRNVRVNAVSPGLIRTDFARGIFDDAGYLRRRLSLTPLRRAGEPEEVANAVLFLASPAGAFVSGHNLVVDGGTTISDGN